MGFWIYMLIIALLLPTTLAVIGCIFQKRSPRNINMLLGYRTARSMKNQSTWQFAHRYCGKLWQIMGFATLPLSLLAMLLVIKKSTNIIGYVGAGCALFCIILMIVSILLTERALRQHFDEYGIPKNKNM